MRESQTESPLESQTEQHEETPETGRREGAGSFARLVQAISKSAPWGTAGKVAFAKSGRQGLGSNASGKAPSAGSSRARKAGTDARAERRGEGKTEGKAEEKGVEPGLFLLHPDVRAWVAGMGWTDLRPVQKEALLPVLEGKGDVLISAATASGKTEAAFLPAISRVLSSPKPGVGILYASPLKALINDQFRRLHDLCTPLGMQLVPWHGDTDFGRRRAFLDNPSGLLLTTPESLESFLLRHATWCYDAFTNLQYVIVDEFHSFVGTARGKQLLSLLRRVEALAHREIPRIALSATFGGETDMAEELRPGRNGYPCSIVSTSQAGSILVQLRAFESKPPSMRVAGKSGIEEMATDLFRLLHGGHNLIFTNSRARAEQLARLLAKECEEAGIECEFFPHHGSLAKELRNRLEMRLLEGKEPTTAVCTATLELGMDIGNMDSVTQVDAPNSVASLRQRLGRAGRRGEKQVLRLFLLDSAILRSTSFSNRLRLPIFQSLAVLELLKRQWYEPRDPERPHYSTLVQQTLSVLGQYGAATPSQLHHLLCETGPFEVDKERYLTFLAGLARAELVERAERRGEIQLAARGQKLVSSQDFTVAFTTPEEFRLVCDGEVKGSIPLEKPIEPGERILFAGGAWKVHVLDEKNRCLHLVPDVDGNPPKFAGAGWPVHDRVRRVMRELYRSGKVPEFCNHTAKKLFREGLETFQANGLARGWMVQDTDSLHILPWRGDRFCSTLVRIIRLAGMSADSTAGVVDVGVSSRGQFLRKLSALYEKGKPSPAVIAGDVQESLKEKFAFAVDGELLDEDNLARFFEFDDAWEWLGQFI